MAHRARTGDLGGRPGLNDLLGVAHQDLGTGVPPMAATLEYSPKTKFC